MSQFQRLEQMVGDMGLRRLQEAFVVVVGLGAVGSYAVEALTRSGLGRLRLIDCDEVRPSNINRQLYALWNTVGRKKCELAVERVAAINPQCKIEALDLFVHADTMPRVLAPSSDGRFPDFVIDAIDSLNPKLELVTALSASGLPFLSSMGAALRTDPSLVRIGPLCNVTHCPLAAILRKHLRRRNATLDFECVYSTEPVRHLRHDAVLPPELSEDNFYPQGRKRASLGSLPTLTGIFGLTAANFVLLKLLGGLFPEQQLQSTCSGVAQRSHEHFNLSRESYTAQRQVSGVLKQQHGASATGFSGAVPLNRSLTFPAVALLKMQHYWRGTVYQSE